MHSVHGCSFPTTHLMSRSIGISGRQQKYKQLVWNVTTPKLLNKFTLFPPFLAYMYINIFENNCLVFLFLSYVLHCSNTLMKPHIWGCLVLLPPVFAFHGRTDFILLCFKVGVLSVREPSFYCCIEIAISKSSTCSIYIKNQMFWPDSVLSLYSNDGIYSRELGKKVGSWKPIIN